MSVHLLPATDVVPRLNGFDAVIDVRSPGEFALDHLPGAVNWPVFSDAERAMVGTMYMQDSALRARQVGAAIVGRRIAEHLAREVTDRPRDWQPLVYCWRGGQRSGAMAWFLGQIGFRTVQLSGGYKGYRALVREQLETVPGRFQYRVLCGRTGSGKTRLLQALATAGAQVLDLEGLARHRGSLLGAVPGVAQPTQKHFDNQLWQALAAFDAARPVYVESESQRIGALQVPAALLVRMREHGEPVHLQMPDAARVDLLLQEYASFFDDVEGFCAQLQPLIPLRGRAVVQHWQAQARAGQWRDAFAALMHEHYDPLYERSLRKDFSRPGGVTLLDLADGSESSMQAAAAQLLNGAAVPVGAENRV